MLLTKYKEVRKNSLKKSVLHMHMYIFLFLLVVQQILVSRVTSTMLMNI